MSAGLVLNDRYRLLERLAIGGMGEVWRASDAVSGREVAVKLLRLELGSDMSARTRFAAEARFAAELRHPGIARAFDFGEQDGRTFLVMELVAGEPLDEILARDGGLPVEAVLDLLVQTARALTVAHAAGIVHRDIKPANLMVSPDGALKITDFGIARRLAAASQTQTGMVMGTAHYISPEQAQGRELSPAADLYSLGVVAYECLTGAPPFDGATPVEVALQHVRDVPAELPGWVPATARGLVMELLAKEPPDRPVDAAAVAERALAIRWRLGSRRLLTSDPIVTKSEAMSGFAAGSAADSLPSRAVAGPRRPAVAYASVAAVLALVCAVVVGSLWRGLAFAGSGADERDPPAPSATAGPVGGGIVDDPADGPGDRPRHGATTSATPTAPIVSRPTVPQPRRTHSIRPSTRETPRTSPSYKPSTNPSRATPTAPEPTPTPTVSTTTPSTPNPEPSPTQSGGLGSEGKV